MKIQELKTHGMSAEKIFDLHFTGDQGHFKMYLLKAITRADSEKQERLNLCKEIKRGKAETLVSYALVRT